MVLRIGLALPVSMLAFIKLVAVNLSKSLTNKSSCFFKILIKVSSCCLLIDEPMLYSEDLVEESTSITLEFKKIELFSKFSKNHFIHPELKNSKSHNYFLLIHQISQSCLSNQVYHSSMTFERLLFRFVIFFSCEQLTKLSTVRERSKTFLPLV